MIAIGLLSGSWTGSVDSENFREVVEQHFREQNYLFYLSWKRKVEDHIQKMWDVAFETVRKLDVVRISKAERIQKLSTYILEKTQATEESILRMSEISHRKDLIRFARFDKSFFESLFRADPQQRINMIEKYQVTCVGRHHKVCQTIEEKSKKGIQSFQERGAAILKKELRISAS